MMPRCKQVSWAPKFGHCRLSNGFYRKEPNSWVRLTLSELHSILVAEGAGLLVLNSVRVQGPENHPLSYAHIVPYLSRQSFCNHLCEYHGFPLGPSDEGSENGEGDEEEEEFNIVNNLNVAFSRQMRVGRAEVQGQGSSNVQGASSSHLARDGVVDIDQSSSLMLEVCSLYSIDPQIYRLKEYSGSDVDDDLRKRQDVVIIYPSQLEYGLRLPLDPFLNDFLTIHSAAVMDLHPNAVRVLTCFIVICRAHRFEPTIPLLRAYFEISRADDNKLTLKAVARSKFLTTPPNKVHNLYSDPIAVTSSRGWNHPLVISDLDIPTGTKPDLSVDEVQAFADFTKTLIRVGNKARFSWKSILQDEDLLRKVGIAPCLDGRVVPLVPMEGVVSYTGWEIHEGGVFGTKCPDCIGNVHTCLCMNPVNDYNLMDLADKRKAFLQQQREQFAKTRLRKENLQKLPESANIPLPISPDGVDSNANQGKAKKRSRPKKKNTVSISEEAVDMDEGDRDSGEKDVTGEIPDGGMSESVPARSERVFEESSSVDRGVSQNQFMAADKMEGRSRKRSRDVISSSPSQVSLESVEEGLQAEETSYSWMKPGYRMPVDDVESLRKISGEIRDVALLKICDNASGSKIGVEILPILKGFLNQCAVEDSGRVLKCFDAFEEKLNKVGSDVLAWENVVARERDEKLKMMQELNDLREQKMENEKKHAEIRVAARSLKSKFEALATENEKLKKDLAEVDSLKGENESLNERLLSEEESRKSVEVANSTLTQEVLNLRDQNKVAVQTYKDSPQFEVDAENKTYSLLQRCTLITARNALGDGAPVDKVVEWASAPMYGELARQGHPQIPFDERELGELARFDREMGHPEWDVTPVVENCAFIKYLDRSSQIEDEIENKKAEVAKENASST